MDEVKKIALVIPSLHAGGGSERVIAELANFYAEKSSLEIHLILLIKAKKFYSINDKVIVHEPKFIHENKNKLYATIILMINLRRTIKLINPESLLSFEEMYNSFVLMAGLYLKTKIFVSDRSKPDKDWGILHNNLRKWMYPKAHGIISQTKYSKQFLLNETKNKNIVIINNPIKNITLSKSQTRENIILSVGRLIKTKNHEQLIRIFINLKLLDWKLIIVGDGPEKENLEKLIYDLEIQNNIILTGGIKNVEEYYNKSKIFAFTSTSEGFPNALGEALSAGLACISYDCNAGPSDLIEDCKNGYLIPENNIRKYSEQLYKMITNEKLRQEFGLNGMKSVERLNIRKVGEEYLNFMLS